MEAAFGAGVLQAALDASAIDWWRIVLRRGARNSTRVTVHGVFIRHFLLASYFSTISLGGIVDVSEGGPVRCSGRSRPDGRHRICSRSAAYDLDIDMMVMV
jgi:hypothetical protein